MTMPGFDVRDLLARCRRRLPPLLGIMVLSAAMAGELPTTRLSATAQEVALCYGGGADDDPAIKLLAAEKGYYSDASPDVFAADCGEWVTVGDYYQVGTTSYEYPLARPIGELVSVLGPSESSPFRMVIAGPYGYRPYRDGTTMPNVRVAPLGARVAYDPALYSADDPATYTNGTVFPVGDTTPDLIRRPAPLGFPDPLAAPFVWATPAPLYSACSAGNLPTLAATTPVPYHAFGGSTAPCYLYERVGDVKMVSSIPASDADPRDDGRDQPYIRWIAPSPYPSPHSRWLETGRSWASTSGEPASPPSPDLQPQNTSANGCPGADADGTEVVPCYRWVLRGKFGEDASTEAATQQQTVSRAGVVRGPNPNQPVILYTVRGFYFDETLLQLVQFERRGVPAKRDDPSQADTSLLFVTTLAELNSRRPDLGGLAVLKQVYRDPSNPDAPARLPQPVLTRVNLGGSSSEDPSRATPPPGASQREVVEWSRRNLGAITTKFDVKVSGDVATVQLGVARSHKRPVDPTGRIDPNLLTGQGAGDIAIEDTTSFVLRSR